MRMRLHSDRNAPTQARRFAQSWARGEKLTLAVCEDLASVITELVSNAVIHGEPPVDVELTRRDGTIRGEVTDTSVALPQLATHPDRRGGFGLRIVDSRTHGCWGTITQHDVKRIWFEILT
jgi:anti-sigma regulatory factor (Ser/Thr protein kinase)